MGGDLDGPSLEKFSDLVRQLLASKAHIPVADTVFEFFIDDQCKYKSWNEKVPEFKYDS